MAKDKKSKHFIEQIIDGDLASGKHGGRIHTRFPPEPNGYLHIGHCKAIVLNFEIAQQYGGLTNLRFDDTNPVAESKEYVDAIRNDIHWLGYDWDDREFYASDYFDELYGFAIKLIKDGKAYVDESSKEEISRMRGVPTEPGEESPYRNRSIEENLRLFEEMKEGKHDEGSMVLRAKVDMSSPNMHMRDPIIYRILKVDHHRTGDKWCIYPNYDFAHGQSDSIEKITHSLCSLEFENHRPLYNWLIEQLEIFPSRQIEFARLNLDYTIMSKRKLLRLVEEGHVNGWDDPRMPTVSGLRRRGYTPDSIKNFIRSVGMSKRQQLIEVGRLEHAVREDLNKKATRRMVVEDPIVLEIENFGDDTVWVDAENNPENPEEGNRRIPVTKELLIERADFMEDPPKKFFRLGPDRIVRLKHAFIIQCTGFDKDENGVVTRVRCKYFEDSWSGNDTSGQKPKGTLHWVSKSEGKPVQLRVYDRLFNDPNPDGHDGKTFIDFINPDSLKVVDNAVAEPAIYDDQQPRHYQFLRKGYYYQDPDSTDDLYIFNRTVTLKDAWAKLKEK
jgi:glutaminyl-tRNA synthetase